MKKKASAPKPEPISEKPAAKKSALSKAVTAIRSGAKTAVTPKGKPAAAKAEPPVASVKKTADKPGPVSPATVVVRLDAGWGNVIHLRGEGPGLSWDSGAPLCCVKDNEWVWVAPAVGAVVFKVLRNDTDWSLGENHAASPGETVTVTPVF